MFTNCPQCGEEIEIERQSDGALVPSGLCDCPCCQRFDDLQTAHPEWADGLETRWGEWLAVKEV